MGRSIAAVADLVLESSAGLSWPVQLSRPTRSELIPESQSSHGGLLTGDRWAKKEDRCQIPCTCCWQLGPLSNLQAERAPPQRHCPTILRPISEPNLLGRIPEAESQTSCKVRVDAQITTKCEERHPDKHHKSAHQSLQVGNLTLDRTDPKAWSEREEGSTLQDHHEQRHNQSNSQIPAQEVGVLQRARWDS